jgi:hypothetical protein
MICPICTQHTPREVKLKCHHSMCQDCWTACRTFNITTCPTCRDPLKKVLRFKFPKLSYKIVVNS